MCMNVEFTIFYSLNCCRPRPIRIILYTVLHAIVFLIFLSQFIYSCVLSSVINVNDFLFVGHCKYSSVLYHFRVIRR